MIKRYWDRAIEADSMRIMRPISEMRWGEREEAKAFPNIVVETRKINEGRTEGEEKNKKNKKEAKNGMNQFFMSLHKSC